jgi:hypothetical protein
VVSDVVDDDVVEGVRAEVSEVGLLSESLDRGEEDVGGRVFLGAGVEAEGGFGSDPAESVEGLAQNLFAVGDEEDAFGVEAVGVESGEPGLSGVRRRFLPGGFVRGLRGLPVGSRGLPPSPRLRRASGDAHGSLSVGGSTSTVVCDPISRQRGCWGMREQALELPDDGFESGALSRVVAGGRDGSSTRRRR